MKPKPKLDRRTAGEAAQFLQARHGELAKSIRALTYDSRATAQRRRHACNPSG
jgi:hypothetical protein